MLRLVHRAVGAWQWSETLKEVRDLELSDVITMMLFDEVFCVCRIKIEIEIVIYNF